MDVMPCFKKKKRNIRIKKSPLLIYPDAVLEKGQWGFCGERTTNEEMTTPCGILLVIVSS